VELVDDGHAARPAFERVNGILGPRIKVTERQIRVQQVNVGGNAQARGPGRRLRRRDRHPPQAVDERHRDERRQVGRHFRTAGSIAVNRAVEGWHGRHASTRYDFCHA
jgi:hypothetical protein